MFIVLTMATVVLAAMAAHLRVGDTKGLARPAAPLVVSVVVFFLRVATA